MQDIGCILVQITEREGGVNIKLEYEKSRAITHADCNTTRLAYELHQSSPQAEQAEKLTRLQKKRTQWRSNYTILTCYEYRRSQ